MEAPDPDIELVPVFQTGNPGLIALAKSLLDAEGIEYLLRGEGVQDLFAWGRFGLGFNPVTGAPVFLVREGDAERARALLRDLEEGGSRDETEEPADAD